MLKLSHEFFGTSDPDQARNAQETTGAAVAELTAAVVNEYKEYFDLLLAARRQHLRDDLASTIATAIIDGAPMPQLESRSYCVAAATAGDDTTSGASAGRVWALGENPDQFEYVAEHPKLVRGLVEESIRWRSPAKITMRSAAGDIEIFDRKFCKGDRVCVGWVSGNRDEQVIEAPVRFKMDRDRALHTSFGWGPHDCTGQHLARTEMRMHFEELFSRVTSMAIADRPATDASLSVSGPKAVPIRYQLKLFQLELLAIVPDGRWVTPEAGCRFPHTNRPTLQSPRR